MTRTSASKPLKRRIILLFAALAAANIGAWVWAFSLFANNPVMLGTAFLAWSLGLRHAVDADHIAAIDNVTRKLMQDGQRPIAVGLWFAIGHSAIVLIAATAIAMTASTLADFESLGATGGIIATIISASFLFAIAIMNFIILHGVWVRFQRVRADGSYTDEDLDMLLAGRGLIARLFRPLFGMVRKSWHMAPLGFLFGLGFDTATEVAILGLSGAHAADGISVGAVLVLPALFAAGMALIDSADGVIMLGAYEWAFVKPIRKLYYNMTITLISALVALVIGGIQTIALLSEKFGFTGEPWAGAVMLSEHFNTLGFLIIGLFIACWGLSTLIYRWKGFDAIEVAPLSKENNI
ncbi:HoxN/HupN/NixA family nickel/cobalt transporter [Sphingomonas sp. KC8]|uniref:HoxN/HupN/NixA family nickel/cobalt transporter n=1 Tax=Sphingomonas sp. KC8 TaxID=1030157 RepID=UPI00024897E3|nr:HoxN/HupN/NixA family nickel/cobalt transporter [Sphingomonas sp. KC8]ARS27801.1 nickel-transporter [Sphingomonas sp. KC8]